VSDDVLTTGEGRWADVRRALLIAYSVALVWSIFVWGIPIDRLLVLTWMAVAFGLGTIGRPVADVKQTARDWFALVAVYIAYDYSRGMADQLGRPVNYTWLARIDRFIFLGRDPNVVMQWHFLKTDVRWYDVVGSIVYMTHFVLPVVPLAYLRVRDRTAWLQYLRRFGLTLYIAVACFVVFPAAPPWMAAKAGYSQPVARITGRGWWELHLKTISKTLDRGAAVMNSVAAMPSLHSGCALLITLWATRNLPWRKRAPFLLFPVVMAVTLVYFGEHYFVDALAGWVLVLAAWHIAEWWERKKGLESPPSLFSRGSARQSERTPTA
jgi:PAP2 superfamily